MENLILIIVFLLLCPSLVLAEDRPSLPKTQDELSYDEKIDRVNKLLYGGFLDIKEFYKTLTMVRFEGDDAKKKGLDASKLTDYLRLKIRNNFANIKFTESENDEYIRKQTGCISVRVWGLGFRR